MNPFKAGQLVGHDTHPEWGPGRILMADGAKVHVFFVDRSERAALLLQLKPDGSPLHLAQEQTHPWLDNLPPFDMKEGRLCLSEKRMTQAQALARFRHLYPLVFRDDGYIGDSKHGERQYKWEAHELYVKSLGNGQAESLLSAGEIGTLAQRFFAVATKTNLLHPNWDKAPLKDALRDHAILLPYLRALTELIAADTPTQPLFESYVAELAKLPRPGSAVASWPVATILPYLARPDRHMLLRPELTQLAAERFGFELNYDARPNWRTYSSLLHMSAQLLKDLRPHGARDFIDVQSFIWVIGEDK